MSRKKYSKAFKLRLLKKHNETGISYYKLEKDNIIAGDDVCFYPLLLYVFYHILINIAWYLTDFSNNI